jgi:hypothetical protein
MGWVHAAGGKGRLIFLYSRSRKSLYRKQRPWQVIISLVTRYAHSVALTEATSVSCEQSGVPVAGVQAHPVYWLPLPTGRSPTLMGLTPLIAFSTSLLPGLS